MYYDDDVSALENITGSIRFFQSIFNFIIICCVLLIGLRIAGIFFPPILLFAAFIPLKSVTAIFIIFVVYLVGLITVIIEGFANLQTLDSKDYVEKQVFWDHTHPE